MDVARARATPPAGEITRRWIWERWQGDAFVPGASFESDWFVRFAGARMIAVRFWGPGSGAWALDGSRGGPWVREEPWLDVEGPILQGRRRSRRLPTASWRQLCLPFPGDDVAHAWNQRVEALPRALRPVPQPALRQVARVEPGFQWQLMRWLDETGRAGTELCESNLALAALVASEGGRRGLDARRAVQWRRRELAGALGLPEREASVRLLRKLRCRSLRPALAARVARWLHDPEALRRVAHVPALGLGCWMFRSASELSWLSDALLAEALASDDPDTLDTLHRFTDCARRLQARGFAPPQPVGALSRLGSEAEAMAARLEALGDRPAWRPLHLPPIPDARGRIEALRTVGDIDHEAHRLRHCVRDYTSDAILGVSALYRVLEPERATLMIHRTRPRGAWKIALLQCTANRSPRMETVRAVERWLAAAARGHTSRSRGAPGG